MKKTAFTILLIFIVLLAVSIVILSKRPAKEAKPAESKVLFAYFSGYRCPPCMKFKLEYLNGFKETYKEKYNGRVEFQEYMTDIPINLTDKNSAEYKLAEETANRNSAILGATGTLYNIKWVGSIPFAVIGSTVFDYSTPETELNKENVERALEQAIKNNETTRLALKLSGHARDYADIMQAARAGDYEAVKDFLDGGADVNQSDITDGKPNGYTALTSAAFGGNMDIVQLLLSHNADINIETNWGATALSMAAMFGRRDIVELLISKGADFDNGRAIAAAAMGTDRPMVQLLKQHGADINKKLKNGLTPLMEVISHSDDAQGGAGAKIAVKAAEILINEGADLDIQDDEGGSLLSHAKSPEMKAFLLSTYAEHAAAPRNK